MDSKAVIHDLDPDSFVKTLSGDDQDNECKNISEVKISFEACGISDSQSSHNTPSSSMDGSNLSFNFNSDRVIEETLKVEKSFMQYVMSIPISPGHPRSPAPMMVGLDHLDNLCRLMEQLSDLREQNSQLKKRVAFLEDIKCLQEMHNRLIMNSCICQNTFPTKAITSGTHKNLQPTSSTVFNENKTKEKDCSIKFKPKRTSKKVDIVGKTQSLSVTKKTRKSRERSKSVSYADELLPKKPKVSKWGRVKEALTKKGKLERMHSAQDTLSLEYHRQIHECRSEDSGIVHLDEPHFEIKQICKDPFLLAEREPSIAESFLSDASTITPLNSSFEDLNKLFIKKKGMPINLTPHTSKQNSHSSEVDIRDRKKMRNVSTEYIKRRQSSPAICSETEDEDTKPSLLTSQTFNNKYAPLENDGTNTNPLKDLYGKKSGKTTWGKMKEIMHPKRGSLRKKSKKGFDKYHIDSEGPSYVSIESMEELDDFHPMGLQIELKTCTESLESSEILSPEKSRYSRPSSSPRILSISQSADASPISGAHKKIKPKLTINIPSEESPPSRKSRWTKVKQVFIGHRGEISGASSAPASPHAKTSGTTFYVDLEALAALGGTNRVFSKNLKELEEISCKTGVTQGETSKCNILSFTLAEDEAVKSHTWERKKSRPDVLDVANVKSHSVSPASSGGSHTVNVEELHRNLSESFSKKLRDWERKRSLKECSPPLERKIYSKDKNKGKGEKNFEKDRKDKSKISRYRKEKDSLNKEDMRKDKSSVGRGEITIHTPSGNFRFQGISDEFTMKLLEWEAMKGFSPEYSTLALLDSHHTRSQSMKESASIESPKSKRPRCRSEGSLIDISQNSVERKTSASSREPARKRSSSMKPVDLEKLKSNENKENLRTSEAKNNYDKWNSQTMPRSCSWKSKYRSADLPFPLMANNRRLLKENEMLEMMIADLNEQLEKLELYGERITLEKGILEAATLQKQQRYEEMVQQLRYELHHLRHINLKLLQQLAKSEKYSSLKYMDMWKSTHDVEKIYECSLQILNQLKELQLTSQQNNRELSELQWYVLHYQANIVLLQNQVQRQTFQLDSLQKSWESGIRRRWNTYGGLDSKFRESLDDFNWKEMQGHNSFFCTDAILPRMLSPMIHQSTTNYGLKLERFNAITREVELKLHHIIKSSGSSKQTTNSEEGSQNRKKKNTTSEKPCDPSTKLKMYVQPTKDQLYTDSKKSDSLDFSLLTHSVDFSTPILSSNLSIPVTSKITTNVATASVVLSTIESDQLVNVNYTSTTNSALTRPTAVVTSFQTVTTSSASQTSSSLPSSPKQIIPSHEKKIYSSHASFRQQSSVEQQSSTVHSNHSPKIDKLASKLTSPKQHIKMVSKVSQISEPVKTRITLSQTDKLSNRCVKVESLALMKDQVVTTSTNKYGVSLDEPFKKKSHIPIYLSPLSPVIPARSPRRLKGEVKTEAQNFRTMNVTPPASIKRRQYATSKSTTTSKTFDEETGELSVTKSESSQTKNITSQNQTIDVDLPTEDNLNIKLKLRTLSEPLLPPHSLPISLPAESTILSHGENLQRIKMEFLSTKNLPLDQSKNLKKSDKKSISSGSSETLHAASTEKISDTNASSEQHLAKVQPFKELSPAASPKTLRISGSPASIRAYLSASRESSLQMSPPVTPKIMRRYPEGEDSPSRPSKLKDLFRKKDKKKKQPMGTVGILCQQTLLLAAASPEIKAGDVESSSEITEKDSRPSFESGDVGPVGTSSTTSSREECPSPESDIERKQGKGKSSLRKFFRLNR